MSGRVGLSLLSLLLTTIVCGSAEAKPQHQQKRQVRVTVGSVEIRDWESHLVKNNPNLRHFHWNPIYANVQSRELVSPPPPPKFPINNKPAHHEIKIDPSHLSFKRAAPRRRIYTNPVQIPTPPQTSVAARPTQQDLSGVLINKDGRLIWNRPKPPTKEVAAAFSQDKVYAKLDRKDVGGQLNHSKVNALLGTRQAMGTLRDRATDAQLASREVSGELISKNTQAELAKPAVASYGDRYSSNLPSASYVYTQTEKRNVYGQLATKRNY